MTRHMPHGLATNHGSRASESSPIPGEKEFNSSDAGFEVGLGNSFQLLEYCEIVVPIFYSVGDKPLHMQEFNKTFRCSSIPLQRSVRDSPCLVRTKT